MIPATGVQPRPMAPRPAFTGSRRACPGREDPVGTDGTWRCLRRRYLPWGCAGVLDGPHGLHGTRPARGPASTRAAAVPSETEPDTKTAR